MTTSTLMIHTMKLSAPQLVAFKGVVTMMQQRAFFRKRAIDMTAHLLSCKSSHYPIQRTPPTSHRHHHLLLLHRHRRRSTFRWPFVLNIFDFPSRTEICRIPSKHHLQTLLKTYSYPAKTLSGHVAVASIPTNRSAK